MLSIRLARFGKKKQPSYRIIVCQKHKDPYGDYIEKIGHVNYFGGTKNIELDTERATYWLSQGAQPTDTVKNLFIEKGIMKGKKVLPHGITPDKDAATKAAADAQEKAAEAEAAASEAAENAEQPADDAAPEEKSEAAEETKAEEKAEPEVAEEKSEASEEKKDA